MRARPHGRAGGTFGDVALVLASLALLAALIYPRFRERAFDGWADAVATDVDRLRTAVEQARDATGFLPATGPVAEVAPALAEAASGTEGTPAVALEWRRLESVEVPAPPVGLEGSIPEQIDEVAQERPAPPPRYFHQGAVSVRTTDEALLGALLRRYPGSFVHDTVWTLLLPRVRAPDAP